MPERISRDDVAQVAKLARLVLSDEDLVRATAQLGDILDHARDMAALDLDGVEPTAHPYPLVNVFRDDVATASLDREEVLASAPAAEDGMFRVPPVIGEEP
ncbi:MAG: Asp-tRNA(Asn)/Glu-tRNA(Gln) amidotransferase subunit GatC [Microthrixaceae bacterium]|nr:Asp-tRNA(Asn)/Glu-tRNA(Gln) amidotransferase subunit GatC [Microthrixaceae bacterium]MCO5313422.1 Asp-tRNA(Asn)/Glu-tRNA(Gln) amidotransferase subunit GatC [Microthrixaceae bacterium]HPB46069.1 Asp-tRNA(Asn)/Glu-tRNA(Gln) amidotransferase subunit GatC [Microthrixaceae bacterium]